jgi:hypothetical protein
MIAARAAINVASGWRTSINVRTPTSAFHHPLEEAKEMGQAQAESHQPSSTTAMKIYSADLFCGMNFSVPGVFDLAAWSRQIEF